MQALLDFVQAMPDWYKAVWVVFCISLGMLVEMVIPLMKTGYHKFRHSAVNSVFILTSMVVSVLMSFIIVFAFNLIEQNQFGLLYIIDLPLWAEFTIAFLLFDFFAQYVAHYMLHRFGWMFKFHAVHHSDTHVDATTSLRHHPGDILIRELYSLVILVLVGAPLAFYLIYRLATIFFSVFTHSNISLSPKLDYLLSFVLVTPNMHKFHHHLEQPWTDKNLGNIFSVWDRVFGTLVYEDLSKVQYGLDRLPENTDVNVLYQLGLPFNKNNVNPEHHQ